MADMRPIQLREVPEAGGHGRLLSCSPLGGWIDSVMIPRPSRPYLLARPAAVFAVSACLPVPVEQEPGHGVSRSRGTTRRSVCIGGCQLGPGLCCPGSID